MVPIELHSAVYEEIENSRQWYDDVSISLGNRFLQEVDRGMERIREAPDTWPAYISGTRRFFLHRFPFAIVYKFDGEKARVFALMHLRRKPGYWADRSI
jgi:hypothetical protein